MAMAHAILTPPRLAAAVRSSVRMRPRVRLHRAARLGVHASASTATAGGMATAGGPAALEWETVNEDPWVLAHNSFRQDFADFAEAVDACIAAPAPWKVVHLSDFMASFMGELESHHFVEDAHFFPEMAKRATLDPRMNGDHAGLMAQARAIADEMASLGKDARQVRAMDRVETWGPRLAVIQSEWAKLRSAMDDHFTIEEQIGLPLFRRTFTPAEGLALGSAVPKLLGAKAPFGLAHLLRLSTAEQRAKFAAKNLPPPIAWLLRTWWHSMFDRQVTRLLREVVSPETRETGSLAPYVLPFFAVLAAITALCLAVFALVVFVVLPLAGASL